MERMLVVVFKDDVKAYEGSRELQRFDEDGSIALYASRVVSKDLDGKVTVTDTFDVLPEGTMGGTAIGSLIGLLGGPVGLAVGAAGGLVIGATTDFARTRVARDFVADVAAVLGPGKTAVIAEIDEESTDRVDGSMEALGGRVFRRALSDVDDSAYEQEVAAIQADIAQTKAEVAASHAERKDALQARIDALNEKLHKTLESAKERREGLKREAAAKVQHLKSQAASARGDLKARQAERVAAVSKRYKDWLDGSESHAK
jgi:uncharacterized membrane protein